MPFMTNNMVSLIRLIMWKMGEEWGGKSNQQLWLVCDNMTRDHRFKLILIIPAENAKCTVHFRY